MAPHRFSCIDLALPACLLCFLVITFPVSVLNARILGFFPSFFKSHQIIHCSVANALAKAGHDVTVLGGTSDVLKNSLYKHIPINGIGYNENFTMDMVNNRQPIYKKVHSVLTGFQISSNETMSRPVVQKFLREHGQGSFDLVIVGYFLNDFHLGLGGHFKCPIIISTVIQPISPINIFIGNPNEIAYVPTIFSGLTQPMNFMNRVKNFLSDVIDRYGLLQIMKNRNDELYEYHFPTSRYPLFKDVIRNVSLVFSNHHSVSQGPIRPNVPGLVEIGGIAIKQTPDPLPRHIAQILDSASEGFIYFSFGSSVQGSAIAAHKAQAMFNVLSKLPYKVIWKWDNLNFPGKSENIFYKTWLPQDDVLAHPNIKLFITHGGHGSIVESQYHGVPMVAIPLYGDQHSNAVNMVKNDFGLRLDYDELNEMTFRDAVEEVLNNSKYRTTVKRFATLYRDRPMAPSELVIYWTEYVLRYNGARHMKSPALLLNEFQLFCLDVIVFLLAIVMVSVSVVVKVSKLFCGCQKRKQSVSKQDKLKKSK